MLNKAVYKLTCLLVFSGELLVGTGTTQADIVLLDYQGGELTFTDGTPFGPDDSIVGTFGFDAIGSDFASSISLAVVDSLGNERFRMELPDTTLPSGGLTLAGNFFDWQGTDLPQVYEVSIFGDVIGGIGDEQISVGDFGDLVVFDFGLPSESSAFNFQAGSFQAVPEPSSVALFGLGLPWYVAFRRRRV